MDDERDLLPEEQDWQDGPDETADDAYAENDTYGDETTDIPEHAGFFAMILRFNSMCAILNDQ